MKTIETIVDVDETRQITLQLPPDVAPGRHQVLVVVDEKNGSDSVESFANLTEEDPLANYQPPAEGESCRGPLGITIHNSGPMLRDTTFRREEIYGDESAA